MVARRSPSSTVAGRARSDAAPAVTVHRLRAPGAARRRGVSVSAADDGFLDRLATGRPARPQWDPPRPARRGRLPPPRLRRDGGREAAAGSRSRGPPAWPAAGLSENAVILAKSRVLRRFCAGGQRPPRLTALAWPPAEIESGRVWRRSMCRPFSPCRDRPGPPPHLEPPAWAPAPGNTPPTPCCVTSPSAGSTSRHRGEIRRLIVQVPGPGSSASATAAGRIRDASPRLPATRGPPHAGCAPRILPAAWPSTPTPVIRGWGATGWAWSTSPATGSWAATRCSRSWAGRSWSARRPRPVPPQSGPWQLKRDIVTAYAAFRVGEDIAFAMEYVPGLDLSRMVRRGARRHACHFARQRWGSAALRRAGPRYQAAQPLSGAAAALLKVLDFGLARSDGGEGDLTSQGRAATSSRPKADTRR